MLIGKKSQDVCEVQGKSGNLEYWNLQPAIAVGQISQTCNGRQQGRATMEGFVNTKCRLEIPRFQNFWIQKGRAS
jgi:hypothetical protein